MKDHAHTLVLMPWLRLASPIAVGMAYFIPYKQDQIPSEFQPHAPDIARILSSYRNIRDNPITECVLVCLNRKEPCKSLTNKKALHVNEAAQLLAFCALSKNEYFSQLGNYTNSTAFQVFFQRFTPGSKWIALTIRRRDGETLSGGHEHGKVKFSIPIQCAYLEQCVVDILLLKALNRHFRKADAQARRLLQAISIYNQAHTDSDVVLYQREITLLASAFEQLFAHCHGANDLAYKVGALLDNYGSKKVNSSTRTSRIQFSKGQEKQEQQWFLHKKWIQELYHLRNDFTHGNDPNRRSWGWSIFEHLVMGSYVFPFLVKILLANSSKYALTETDLYRLGMIDRLLNLKNWGKEVSSSGSSKWRKAILDYEHDQAFKRAFEQAWKKLKRRRRAKS